MKAQGFLIAMLSIFLFLFFFSCNSDDSDDVQKDDNQPADDDDDNDDDNDDNNDDSDIEDEYTTDTESPLCDEWDMDPEDLEDAVHIHCLMEKGSFAPAPNSPQTIRVVDWNIERGYHLDDFIYHFQNDPILSEADIILIQEADRHCSRTGYRNITNELAQALGMDYVYAVEFVELAQDRGEHGNAILSRFPIVDQRALRHTDFEKWYEDQGEPRLGGRITIQALIDLGNRILQVASVHYTSGVAHYFTAHQTQTQETLDFLDTIDETTIFGGDLNTGLEWLLRFEPSIDLILDNGYEDALAALPHSESITHPGDIYILNARLDWIFFMDATGQSGDVFREPPLNSLSDHYGLYADFEL